MGRLTTRTPVTRISLRDGDLAVRRRADTLVVEEPLEVVPGGAHGHDERRSSDSDLERLLHGKGVRSARLARAECDPDDRLACGDASHAQPPIAFMPRAGCRKPGSLIA